MLLMVDDDHPYANSTAEYTVESKGMLGTNNFFGASSYIVKPFADPDMISLCYVHECNATRLNWVSPLYPFLIEAQLDRGLGLGDG
jgi:hypothetical protein